MTYVNAEWLEDSGLNLSVAAVGLWTLLSDHVRGTTGMGPTNDIFSDAHIETRFGSAGLVALGELLGAGVVVRYDKRRNWPCVKLVRHPPRERTDAWFRRERARAAKLRDEVIQCSGLWCHICEGAVDEDDVHIDHIIPLSRGGDSDFFNLGVAHSACNIKKGAKLQ